MNKWQQLYMKAFLLLQIKLGIPFEKMMQHMIYLFLFLTTFKMTLFHGTLSGVSRTTMDGILETTK